jgi:hypothetical protein
MALYVCDIDGNVRLMEQQCELENVAIEDCRMQEVVTLIVLCERVGTVR